MKRWSCVLLVVAAVATAQPALADEAPLPRLAYSASSEGWQQIFLARLDGSAPVRLTRGHIHSFAPTWSPDGAFIAFERWSYRAPHASGIYVVPTTGGPAVRLTTGHDYQPSWSPDGSTIVFARAARSGATHLYAVNADGTGLRRLTSMQAAEPAWSPDGTQIAFIGYPAGIECGCIYVMRPDGTSVRKITAKGWHEDVTWSPDGRSLAFSKHACWWPPCTAVFVSTRWGRHVRALTPQPASGTFESSPTWSPGGTIVFSRGYDLWSVGVDGSDLHPLGIRGFFPAWEPAA